MEDLKEEFKINDVVYYESHWVDNQIQKAKILSFQDERQVRTKGLNFAGTEGALISDLYRSEKECLDAAIARHEKAKQDYCDEITTVNDLVTFMFNHCITGDDYEYDAREVVVKKAEEFGINLVRD